MLDSRHLWLLATRIPRAFSGWTLHRWALEAMHSGRLAIADRLFEAAAGRYRVELAVEPLARLRAHQLIGRVRALDDSQRSNQPIIEVERLLSRLSKIESLAPPFELVEARTLLATWLSDESRESGAEATREAA